MAIMFEPKGRTSTETVKEPDVLPLGQKPEGELNTLLRMENAFNKLVSSMKLLQDNIDKLKDENKRLKDALGLTEVKEPLVLTKDMEIKNGHQ
jgi:FtsZ-binding cell division protein ZapB